MAQTDSTDIGVSLSLDASDFRKEINDADRVAKGFSSSLSTAFAGVALKGKGLGDVVGEIGLRLSKLSLDMAFKPVEQGITNLFQPFTASLGGAMSGTANVTPFAKGGVLAAPSYFPMPSGGLGLAGERGAEAILPLARGPDGSLGVRADGGAGGNSHVTINISTPDVEGFQRSRSEVAAALARMVGRGRRSL